MVIKKISTRIINWHTRHGRKNLPWQIDINPYRVWVSEIMLQQTQVTTVIPYYERFMKEFPTVEDLARSSEEKVLTYWSGLGYYSRARNLHKAAKRISSEHHGQFPQTVHELSALPGIGRSTAGAILSLGMQLSAPILDGNVKRVLARFYGIKEPVNKSKTINKLWNFSELNTPITKVNYYNQGIMDLGATLCTRTPNCLKCPLKKDCQSFENKETHLIPFVQKSEKKRKLKTSYFLIIKTREGNVLLEKRPPTGIWGGLFCFLEFSNINDLSAYCNSNLRLNIDSMEKLPSFIHKFSHFDMEINPILYNTRTFLPIAIAEDTHIICSLSEALEKALPAPINKLISSLLSMS